MSEIRPLISCLIQTALIIFISNCAHQKLKVPDTRTRGSDAGQLVLPAEHPGTSLQSMTDAGDTSWTPPDETRFFTLYNNSAGLLLESAPENWLELPCIRSTRGLPVKTLINNSDRRLRLRIFDARLPDDAIPPGRLDSILGYLFKVEPVSKTDSSGFCHAELYLPASDTRGHWLFKLQDSFHLTLFYFDRKSGSRTAGDLAASLAGLRCGVADKKSSNPPARVSAVMNSALLNASGLLAVQDSNYSLALNFFKKAWQLDRDYVPYISNVATVYHALDETVMGVQYLMDHMAIVKNSGHLSGLLGALYEALSQYQAARKWALYALELEPDNVEWLINLSDALWQLGEKVQSKNVLLRHYSARPGFRLSVYLAGTYLGLEEFNNAKIVLEEAHLRHRPTLKSVEYTMMAYNGLKQHELALVIFRKYEYKFTSALMYTERAVAEFSMKYYLPSEYSIQRALDLDPSFEKARELAAKINTVMGAKDNLIISSPIEPLPMESAMSDIRRFAGPAHQKSPYPMVLLRRNALFHWKPGRKWRRTYRFIYAVSIRDSLALSSELTFEFNPAYSKFYVNRFDLYDSNLVKRASRETRHFYVTRNHNTTIHPDNLLVHLPINAQGAPTYLDILVSEEAVYPSGEFPYLQYSARYPFPCLSNEFVILDAPPNLNIFTFGGARLEAGGRRTRIIFGPEPHPAFEKFSPAYEEYGSGYSIAPPKTWKAAGAEYQDYLHRTGTHVDSIPFAVRELAGEILAREGAGAKPIRSLYQWVRDSVRFNDFEFSLHALLPENSRDVMLKKKSDCKGQALLLIHLLRSRGIKARLCLTSLIHTGYANQPTLHQFNHMLVYVPDKDNGTGFFLDPTDKNHPFRKAPYHLQGKLTLILENSGGRIQFIPEVKTPLEHLVRISHRMQFKKNKTVAGKDSIIISGKLAADFRSRLSGWARAGKMETLMSWLTQSLKGYWKGNLAIAHENDKDSALIFVLDYQQQHQDNLSSKPLHVGTSLERSFMKFPTAETRRTPIYFPYDVEVQSHWFLSAPKRLAILTASTSAEDSVNNLKWRRIIRTSSKSEAEVAQNWSLSSFLAPPSEYRSIKRRWDGMLEKGGFELAVE